MNSNLKGIQKVLASLAMVTTVVSMGGFAALPTAALAAVPADYGLHEGDMISADGLTSDANYDPDIYIVNDWGYKRLFLNPVIFNFYGHLSGGWAAVKHVSAAVRDAFPTSGLFRNCETNDQAVWGLQVTGEDTGVLHHIAMTGAQAVAEDPNFFKKVFCINNNEANWYPKGADYTSLSQVPDYSRGGSTSSPTPTPTPGPGTPLRGGAGSLVSANFVSSLDNEEVGEGENKVPVVGLNLKADNGSDLRVISAKVTFDGTANGHSDRLSDYADQVQVWMGSTQVATVDVADFNKDSAGIYSKSISLTGDGVILMDSTVQLKVSVSAISNFDSQDISDDDWDVSIDSVRFVDAEGAITTDTTTPDIGVQREGPDFVSFQTATDLELKLTENTSNNPDDGVVQVDASSGKDHVLLLSGNLKATGSDFTIQSMQADVTTASDSLDSIATGFTLELNGTEVDSVDAADCAGGPGADTYNCVFDNIDDYAVSEGSTATVKVFANVNGTDSPSDEGESLQATVDNSNTAALDQNGDDVLDSNGDLPGTVDGGTLTFYSEGIMAHVTSITESKTSDGAGTDTGTYEFKFTVTSFGSDAHVDSDDACSGISRSQSSGSEVDCTLSSTADEDLGAGNGFLVSDGTTESFTVTIAAQGDVGGSFVKVHLDGIDYFTDNTADTLDVSGLDSWESDSQFLAHI